VIVFLALIPAYILSIFYRSFLSVISAPIMADLNIGPRELGFMASSWFVTFAIAQFPVGWALDRLGPRRTVIPSMLVGVLGAFLFAFSPDVVTASLAMALIGIGCSPVFMGALYVFARLPDKGRFAGLASLFIILGSVGNLLGTAPLGRLALSVGWRPAMAGIACFFLLAALLVTLFLRDPPRAESADAGGEGIWSGIRAVLSIRALWFLFPITFCSYAILVTVRGLWVVPFLSEVHALPARESGDAAFLMALTMTLGAMLYAVAERWLGGPKRTMALGTAAFALCFVALALVGDQSATLAVALFCLTGLIGFNYAILMAWADVFAGTSGGARHHAAELHVHCGCRGDAGRFRRLHRFLAQEWCQRQHHFRGLALEFCRHSDDLCADLPGRTRAAQGISVRRMRFFGSHASPGAFAAMASACTRSASSAASTSLTMRWRCSRDLPAKA
jgi:MFS family permease